MPRNTSHAIVNPTTLKTLTKSILAISLSMAGLAHAELYSSVTFFGDSLTDGGYFKKATEALGHPQSGQYTTNPDNTCHYVFIMIGERVKPTQGLIL